MEIRLISSLTPDDEDRISPALVNVLAVLLDGFSLAHTVRIKTTSGAVYERSSPPVVRPSRPLEGSPIDPPRLTPTAVPVGRDS